eukprot:TRINITY_DN2909_c0_g1_i1.p1 TRINITY_DN2909_c0_g1~~TRINITY_DN2909_c0_g1_i1.p1  ORF type:complete len:135 (-),score=43.00 TRINITY_DN2909_c0_g1_i1:60-464(-)
MCKTLVLENTACTNSGCEDPNNSRFYCVVIQYIAQLQTHKVFKFVRSLMSNAKKDNYHFRMAYEQDAIRLTGYEHNAICPIGTTVPVPVIVALDIAKLPGDWMWLGGGQVDLKLGCSVSEFIHATHAFVTDIYK